MKGRYHQKQIGGHKFYWNSSRFTVEDARLVAFLLERRYDEIRHTGPAGAGTDWDDESVRRSLQEDAEREAKLGRHKPVPIARSSGVGQMAPAALPPSSRAPHRSRKLVTINRDTTVAELVEVYLERLSGSDSSPSRKRMRALKARLQFTVKKHYHIALHDLSAATVKQIADEINARTNPKTNSAYEFYYRRDVLKEFGGFLRFLDRFLKQEKKHSVSSNFELPPDLDTLLRATHSNTQESVKRKQGPHEWTEDKRRKKIDDIAELLKRATVPLRAFLLLALNCGYSTSEIGHLTNKLYTPPTIDWARPKTLQRSQDPPRMIHNLWPETVKAIEAARNPDRTNPTMPLFVNTKGRNVKDNDWVGKQFRRLAKSLGIQMDFHELRKVSATLVEELAGGTGLSSFHLGHTPVSVAFKHYVNPTVLASQLKKVTDRIRDHLKIPETLTSHESVTF